MKHFTERFEKHGIWWRKYMVLHELIREFVRGTFLEISLRAIARGFESHPLRQVGSYILALYMRLKCSFSFCRNLHVILLMNT